MPTLWVKAIWPWYYRRRQGSRGAGSREISVGLAVFAVAVCTSRYHKRQSEKYQYQNAGLIAQSLAPVPGVRSAHDEAKYVIALQGPSLLRALLSVSSLVATPPMELRSGCLCRPGRVLLPFPSPAAVSFVSSRPSWS